MDVTYKQEVGVGALVLVGFALFIGLLFWLTDRRVGADGVNVPVVFTNVAGLDQGDPVMISGVKVGRVASVRLERTGRVHVILNVVAAQRPRTDASVAIAALDFLGSKFIKYEPGASDSLLPAGRAIVGTQAPEIVDVASGVAERVNSLLANAEELFSDQLGTDIHNTLVATQRAMTMLADAKDHPFIQQTTRTLAATERAMSRVDSILGGATGARLDTLSANLSRLTGHLGSASAAVDTLLRRINRGEGTLGRLASDSTLYHNLHALSAAMTALLTDLRQNPDKYMKPGMVRVKLF